MNFIKENVTIDENCCWNWNKSTNSSEYGQFYKNKKYWTTHRYVYFKTYGEIPDNLVVRHTCHNRRCCNPEHLLIGTSKDNWYDSEEIHRMTAKRMSSGYIINGIKYDSAREVREKLGLSFNSITKFTDKNTREFNIEKYRIGCRKANRTPRV